MSRYSISENELRHYVALKAVHHYGNASIVVGCPLLEAARSVRIDAKVIEGECAPDAD